MALTGAVRLFALPDEEKLPQEADQPHMPGFGAYGQSNSPGTRIPSLLKSWTLSRPTPKRFPADLIDAWTSFMHLDTSLRGLAESTLTALDLAFSTPGELLSLLSVQGCGLRLLHYPHEPLEESPEKRRQSVQRDSSLITLFPRPTDPGLTLKINGTMKPVMQDVGDVIVIAGSALDYAIAGLITPCTYTIDGSTMSMIANNRTALVHLSPPLPGRGSCPNIGNEESARRLAVATNHGACIQR